MQITRLLFGDALLAQSGQSCSRRGRNPLGAGDSAGLLQRGPGPLDEGIEGTLRLLPY